MPDGRTHTTATLLWTAASIPASLICGAGWHSITIAAGALTGIVMTPDLDVEDGCYSHYIVRKYAGMILYWIWKGIWWPYAKLIAHRSPVSHFPVFSTIVRLLYLMLFASPFIVWLGLKPTDDLMSSFPFFFIGLAISDSLHITMDRFWRN